MEKFVWYLMIFIKDNDDQCCIITLDDTWFIAIKLFAWPIWFLTMMQADGLYM